MGRRTGGRYTRGYTGCINELSLKVIGERTYGLEIDFSTGRYIEDKKGITCSKMCRV